MHIPVNESLGPPHDLGEGPISGLKRENNTCACISKTNLESGNPFMRGSLLDH